MAKPVLWKLAPAAVNKPWGLVNDEARRLAGVDVGVGEFWLASAQTGPGNYSNTIAEPSLRMTLAEALREAKADGAETLESLIGARAAAHLSANPHRGKTESWHIRSVEGRTGVAAGPRTKDDAERLERIIRSQGLPPDVTRWSDEVCELFGLILPLQGGEVFLAPAGALHTMFAIGPESRLIIDEIQQGYGEALLPTLSKILCVQDNLLSVQVHPNDETVAAAAEGQMDIDQDLQANPTVRIYDFGRRPGEYPELGFRLVDPEAGLLRVQPVTVGPSDGVTVEAMVAAPEFVKCRLRLSGARTDLQPLHGSYRVLHCSEGQAEVSANSRTVALARGETVLVPAALEAATVVRAEGECVLFDDAFPDIPALSAFLGRHGASVESIESLLSPPRALPAE